MANAIYPLYKNQILTEGANTSLTGTTAADAPVVALIDTGTYGYSPAHSTYANLSGIIGTPQQIVSPTVGTVAAGVFDGDNVTFTSVTGASVEALVIWVANGTLTGATSWLVVYEDTGVTGLPVTPNGGDISVTFSASGIFLI